MKFLIDVQLPPLLKHWFAEKSHEAIHASELPNGLTLMDAEIWEIAKERNYIIVTKDIDFFDMSLLYGKPPDILLIRYGNCSNKVLLQRIENAWSQAQQILESQTVRMIVLYPEKMETYI